LQRFEVQSESENFAVEAKQHSSGRSNCCGQPADAEQHHPKVGKIIQFSLAQFVLLLFSEEWIWNTIQSACTTRE
jgi:hypothetical protein